MKKLLIASLALGMLIVFTGVASAQVWWLSKTEITRTLTGTKEKTQTNGNTTLVADNGTVKGYLVMETAGESIPATNAIDQIFFCGTNTSSSGKTTAFELLFGPYIGAIATDTVTLKTHVHNETGHIYAAGSDAFVIQTADIPAGTATGPADLLLTSVTYALNDATDILHISVIGTLTGAFAQSTTIPPGSDSIFTGAFTTELLPTTDTAICCCNGVITTNGSCPCS